METPEQYTKTADYVLANHFDEESLTEKQVDKIIKAMEEYASEALTAYNLECKRNDDLQEEVERLKGCGHSAGLKNEAYKKALLEAREENKLYREALNSIIGIYHRHRRDPVTERDLHAIKEKAQSILSKFQPKKDESTNSTGL